MLDQQPRIYVDNQGRLGLNDRMQVTGAKLTVIARITGVPAEDAWVAEKGSYSGERVGDTCT